MIGINKYISVKVWLDSSHLENFLKHVFKMRVNWKFDFRQDWKFCWDLSNANSGGNWLFRSDYVFSGGTLYPSANYAFNWRWIIWLNLQIKPLYFRGQNYLFKTSLLRSLKTYHQHSVHLGIKPPQKHLPSLLPSLS